MEEKGSDKPRARYVWDPDKLSWVETAEEVTPNKTRPEEVSVESTLEEGFEEVPTGDSTVEAVTETGNLVYRGALIRLGAIIIDYIVLSIIGFIIAQIPGLGDNRMLSITYTTWIMLAIGLVYFAGFWSWRGQTLGKIIVGARVVRSDGSPISPGNAVLRYLFYLVPTFTPILFFAAYISGWIPLPAAIVGLIIIATSSRKRGLHDRIAGTVVINTRAQVLLDYADEEEYEEVNEAEEEAEALEDN